MRFPGFCGYLWFIVGGMAWIPWAQGRQQKQLKKSEEECWRPGILVYILFAFLICLFLSVSQDWLQVFYGILGPSGVDDGWFELLSGK